MSIYVKLALVLAIIVALGAGYRYVDSQGYKRAQAEYVLKERDAALKFATQLKEAGEQHDKDRAVIDRLAADVRRVRIKFPTPTTSCADTDGRGRTLSSEVDDAFERLQEATGSLIERCDQLNIDAIRLNATLR